jgi:hypothetical protein
MRDAVRARVSGTSKRRGIGAVALCAALLGAALAAPALAQEGTGAAAPASGAGATSAEAAVAEAMALRGGGDPESADELVLRWLADNPDGDAAAATYSVALRNVQAFDDAQAFLRRAIEADTGNSAARFELATLLLAELRFAEAAEVLAPIEPGAREHTFAQGNLVTARFLSGDIEGALAISEANQSGRAALFAAAQRCELLLARSGAAEGRACLDAARATLGEHDAFFGRQVYLDYREGNAEAALRAVRAVQGTSRASARSSALLVLAPLALSDLDAAEAGLEAMQISVLGERSALRALVALARGDEAGARSAWEDAAARNPLFADPARAGAVLLWDPSLAEGMAALLGHAEGSGGAAPGPTAPSADEEVGVEADAAAQREEIPQTAGGCCATVPARGAEPTLLLALALVALVRRSVAARYRQDRRADGRGARGGCN